MCRSDYLRPCAKTHNHDCVHQLFVETQAGVCRGHDNKYVTPWLLSISAEECQCVNSRKNRTNQYVLAFIMSQTCSNQPTNRLLVCFGARSYSLESVRPYMYLGVLPLRLGFRPATNKLWAVKIDYPRLGNWNVSEALRIMFVSDWSANTAKPHLKFVRHML